MRYPGICAKVERRREKRRMDATSRSAADIFKEEVPESELSVTDDEDICGETRSGR